MLSNRMLMAAAAGGGAFSADAVVFDGTNDYMLRGGGLTGQSDTDELTIAAVFKMNGGDGAEQTFLAGSLNNYFVRRASNKLYIVIPNTSFSGEILQVNSSNDYIDDSTWHTAIFSVKSSTSAYHFYVDGSSDVGATGGSGLGSDIGINSSTDWAVGARTGGGQKLNADAAYVAMWPAYFDLTNAATLAQFYTGGKPTDWSAVGSPIILQGVPAGGVATDFATNQGTGGDFSITGTLTLASTTPWD
jgi:hypothetical protein